jgi:hypothetical protein
MQGTASTGAQRTKCVREHRMRSGNAADGRSWTVSVQVGQMTLP